jgi:hypothetical protein
MDLLTELNTCTDSEVEEMIESAIFDMNEQATKVEKLGFLDAFNSVTTFKGFIPFDTRIKYSNLGIEDYNMNTTDFFYEFADYVKKHKINSRFALVQSIETFTINYFGYPSNNISREDVFQDKAWNSTTTDEEYFEALERNSLGDLKELGAAQCTERSALAEQLLSLFGFETYYVIGKVNYNDKEEDHAYNIVKRKNDYALLDYSIPCPIYNNKEDIIGYAPFIGIMTKEEFEDFITNNELKEFHDFYYVDGKAIQIYDTRSYSVNNKKNLKRKAILD